MVFGGFRTGARALGLAFDALVSGALGAFFQAGFQPKMESGGAGGAGGAFPGMRPAARGFLCAGFLSGFLKGFHAGLEAIIIAALREREVDRSASRTGVYHPAANGMMMMSKARIIMNTGCHTHTPLSAALPPTRRRGRPLLVRRAGRGPSGARAPPAPTPVRSWTEDEG